MTTDQTPDRLTVERDHAIQQAAEARVERNALRQSLTEAEASHQAETGRLRAERDEAKRVIRNAHQAIRENTTAAAVALAMFDKRDDGGPSLLDELKAVEAERDTLTARLAEAEKRTQLLSQADYALRILVGLKDGPRDGDYERDKVLAWELARAAVDAVDEHRGSTRAETTDGQG